MKNTIESSIHWREMNQEEIDSKLFTSTKTGFVPIQAGLPTIQSSQIEEEEFELDLIIE